MGDTDLAARSPRGQDLSRRPRYSQRAQHIAERRIRTVCTAYLQNGGMAPVMPHIDSRRRAEEALNLRAEDYTWQEIADKLGFRHREGARHAVKRLLASTRRPTIEELRAESAESHRVLRRRLWERLHDAERDGDTETATKVAREIRASLDSAARLGGLNTPQRTEVNVAVDVTPNLAAAEWLRQIAAAATAVSGGGQPAGLASAATVIDAEVIP